MIASSTLSIIYLIGSVTFILGLKMLSKPDTARKGNLIAAAGMSLAIVGTIFLYKVNDAPLHNYGWIFTGLLIGGVIGVLSAKKVKMTAMPEMVSMFNGMGGACAALISIVEYNHIYTLTKNLFAPVADDHLVLQLLESSASKGMVLIILLSLVIGAVSCAGSIVAWGKLTGKIKDFSFSGAAPAEPGCIGPDCRFICMVAAGVQCGTGHRYYPVLPHFCAGIILRSAFCASNRWCRYAGGHLPVKLFYRCGSGLRRIFIQQPGDAHGRYPGGFCRNYPHHPDV